MTEYFGGIEAGGTKFICAIGQGQGDIKEEKVIPTKTPEETLPEVCDFFKPYKLSGITLGSFGPFDKREGSPTYGHILKTNKTAWINCPIVETLSQNLKAPIYLETDVTTSAIGEYYWGAGKGCNNFIYLVSTIQKWAISLFLEKSYLGSAIFMTIASKVMPPVRPSREDGKLTH